MPDRTALAYCYDGSFAGMLSCIYESFRKKEIPAEIYDRKKGQLSLLSTKEILTDPEKAERVAQAVWQKIGKDAYETVELGYYCSHPQKELLVLQFVWLGMKYGRSVMRMLTDDTVSALNKAILHLTKEAHQYKGFVRFSIYEQVMAAVIEPKHYVLPLLAPHFCDRYANDAFLIYDKTHRAMLLYQRGRFTILDDVDYQVPHAEQEELYFRSLWKRFYDTIAIEERYNPRCRMTHMQKRYWNQLTELQDQPFIVKPEKKAEGKHAIESTHGS